MTTRKPRTGRTYRRLTPKQRAEITRLSALGLCDYAVGKIVGRDSNVVHRVVHNIVQKHHYKNGDSDRPGIGYTFVDGTRVHVGRGHPVKKDGAQGTTNLNAVAEDRRGSDNLH